ncbi:MAG: DUF3341 domain-containing protein [Candidatus Marinimicrobia bacterium]|jgi:hypothetical protein|nr:DUF3341 domain-containing protein [Candidatus Neomarinimicrobiota bacterium]MBT3630127.1 DUF3341 domain-containing protein [Candidatus Neomarinimicrobiota bacterium]MBT3826079.1 DUF3341 domain-containing protein [Candidatus Neomarinimicrobiota bacterium]MBT4132113.1 DUF3341 domain-containing protein [Candidatus Neomarinimicrobiota bacterium]MBT4296600.1 DUF3341 domain-containing protein [Candidatus Neomarinimicrobiota bacterium]
MSQTLGALARFANPAELIEAAKKIRDAGYKSFDCHSPFPIHGMDDAMGLKRSPLGYIVGGMTLAGATIGMGLQYWVAAVEYPLVISGKPFFSWQAFVIVTFALFVLFGAFGAVFGMFHLNRLPRLHHPVFYSDKFAKVTDDAFYVSIESDDEQFDDQKIQEFLSSIGGTDVELVAGE